MVAGTLTFFRWSITLESKECMSLELPPPSLPCLVRLTNKGNVPDRYQVVCRELVSGLGSNVMWG
jgi:hypothetical protein